MKNTQRVIQSNVKVTEKKLPVTGKMVTTLCYSSFFSKINEVIAKVTINVRFKVTSLLLTSYYPTLLRSISTFLEIYRYIDLYNFDDNRNHNNNSNNKHRTHVHKSFSNIC